MFCPKCGAQCPDFAAFCNHYGAPLQQSDIQQQNQYGNPQGNYQTPPNYNNGNAGYGMNGPGQAPYPPNYSQNGFHPGNQYRAPIQNRSIALCIVLSIVTCGIYGIYWMVCLVNDLNVASGRPTDTSGGVVFLLSIVTCSIYLLYWFYKAGEKVSEVKQRNGEIADSSTGILYLILCFFGLSIVNYALIQNELNKVASN